MVQLDQDRSAEQARTLVLHAILMPQIKNSGCDQGQQRQGESLREQDTTADDDWRGGEWGDELRKAPAAHPKQSFEGQGQNTKTGLSPSHQTGQSRHSAEVRQCPCDQCQVKAMGFFPKLREGAPHCVFGCYQQKLLCWKDGVGEGKEGSQEETVGARVRVMEW